MKYFIVCAPPGTGERAAVRKVQDFFNGASTSQNSDQVAVVDIEDKLCKSQQVRDALSRISGEPVSARLSLGMRNVTELLPRNIVKRLWEEQLQAGLNELFLDNRPIKIVLCHTMLYGQVRSEFYSPVNVSAFRKNSYSPGNSIQYEPTHVLLLLDDVYDMFCRLSAENDLFGADSLQDELQQIWFNAGHKERGPVGFSRTESAYLKFRWQISRLTLLLNWRNSETLTAENLAGQLGAKFLAMSVKQYTEVAAKWLNENAKAVYLSHPITQSRLHQIKTGKWDSFVYTFNQIQERMLEENVLCIMPTAIDEFRLRNEPITSNKGSSGVRRPIIGPLQKRWLLPNSRLVKEENSAPDIPDPYAHLLYTSPGDDIDIDHHYFFGEAGLRLLESLGTGNRLGLDAGVLLEAFADQVRSQVSARDHLLVAHSDALLVYRALYNADGFAGGVNEEIKHWYKREDNPRIGFIHFREDIVREIKKETIRKNMNDWSISEAARTAVQRSSGQMQEKEAKKVIESYLQPQGRSNIGNASRAEVDTKKQAPSLLNEAKISFIWEQLTKRELSSTGESSTSVWIVNNDSEIWELLPEAGKFLNAASPRPSPLWKNIVIGILTELEEWHSTSSQH